MRALKAGDQPKVVELLEAGVELERRDAFENTPLILACHYAHEPLALELLRRGADATAANEQGCTALLHACIEGLPTLAEELLLRPAVLPAPAPAPVYSRHTDETAPRTPLLGAAESGFAHGVRLLLRRGVPPEPEALTLAAAHGHAEVCSLLLATALATAAATATAAAAAAATAAAAAAIAAATASVSIAPAAARTDSAAFAAASVFAAAADGGSGKVMGMARRNGTHCSGQETPPTRGRVCRCNGACPRACVSRVSLFERGHTAGIVHDALVTSRLAGQ